MKYFLCFITSLFIAGSIYPQAANKEQFTIKSYPVEEKALKIEISKMWKDGWYPRGVTFDGADKLTVVFIKNGTEMYKDWLIRFSSAGAIKQDTIAEIGAGWMPVDITVGSGKSVQLFLKPKEVIRVWDNAIITVELMPIVIQKGEYKKSLYSPSGLFLDGGNLVTLKIQSPIESSFSFIMRTYPADDASVIQGIEQASAEGLKPWGIEKSGGEMKVIYFNY
jgi:hypothetical protein